MSKVIQELGKACEEWGFFVLVNHGIPETLIQGIIDAAKEFFDLPEDEKQNVSDPIKYGNGSVITTSNQKIFLWKDLLKFPLHPEFHCPVKPPNLR
ncbi:leucoanthocyanidin dioxygenase-like [Olea europaea var. sylvestris]|nr:leucoanthocyanidin dioxygenase-like [Olea europaea var. sylvestris]